MAQLITSKPKMHAPNSNDGYPKKNLQFGSSLKVLVAQASGYITICLPPQGCRPISGSIDNLKTSKCMRPIQMMDTLRKFFNLGAHLRF
jgi:hypothetical protein